MQPALYRRVTELVDKSKVERKNRGYWVRGLFEALDWGARAAYSIEKQSNDSFDLSLEGCPVISVLVDSPGNVGRVYPALNRAYNRDVPWLIVSDFSSLALFGSYWISTSTDLTNSAAWHISSHEYLLEAPRLNLLTPHQVARNELDQVYDAFPFRKKKLPIDVLLVERMAEWRHMALQALKINAGENDPLIHRFINSLILVRYFEDSALFPQKLKDILCDSDHELKTAISKSFIDVRKRASYPTLTRAELTTLQGAPLKRLLRQLYGFEEWGVEYDFSAIGVDILGRFYEEYLKLKPSQVVVETKNTAALYLFEPPTFEMHDIRREKGIYYTPSFLVQHIVSNLVRRYHASNSAVPPLVADLACGSGTFLISALGEIQSRGLWRANAAEQIFGFDSDQRAVEASRLNLATKCLADNPSAPVPVLNLFHYNLLLQGTETARSKGLIPSGGFDIIVGNPPYLNYQTLTSNYDLDILKNNFELAQKRTDSYMLFIEGAVRLLKPGGFCGFVLPNTFFRSASANHLRSWLAANAEILEIIDFQDQPVFQNVAVYVCVVLLRKRQSGAIASKITVAKVHRLSKTPASQLAKLGVGGDPGDETQEVFQMDPPKGSGPWILRNPTEKAILEKISLRSEPLKDINVEIKQGIKTGADNIFIVEREESKFHSSSKSLQIEKTLLLPILRNRELRRWHSRARFSVIFPYDQDTGKLLPWSKLKKEFPNCARYLEDNRVELSRRKSLRGKAWYELIEPRVASILSKSPKLFIAELGMVPQVCVEEGEHSAIVGSAGGGSWIIVNNEQYDVVSLAAYLNSSISEWCIKQIASPRRGGWFLFEGQVIGGLPVPNFLRDASSFARAELARLSGEAQRVSKAAESFQSLESRQHISRIENQIDSLIFESLELTASEAAYVRGRILNLRGISSDSLKDPLF